MKLGRQFLVVIIVNGLLFFSAANAQGSSTPGSNGGAANSSGQSSQSDLSVLGVGSVGPEIQENLSIFSYLAGLPNTDIGTFIGRVIRLAIGFIGIVLVLLIIYSGLVWMTSGGDEEKVSKAKKTLVNAIVGLIIIFSATSIVTFILRQLTNGGSSNASSTPL